MFMSFLDFNALMSLKLQKYIICEEMQICSSRSRYSKAIFSNRQSKPVYAICRWKFTSFLKRGQSLLPHEITRIVRSIVLRFPSLIRSDQLANSVQLFYGYNVKVYL